MTATATETTATPAKAKPPVLDSKGQTLELGMRVKVQTDKDKDAAGKPLVGTITGLEYQRQRAVIKLDSQEKLVVRPAGKLLISKTKSGKIERVERAVRAGRKAAATADA